MSVNQLAPLGEDPMMIDAPPYIDNEEMDAARALIEEECRRYRPTKNYLDHRPIDTSRFETELMTAEFERISDRQPMEEHNLSAPVASNYPYFLNVYQRHILLGPSDPTCALSPSYRYL